MQYFSDWILAGTVLILAITSLYHTTIVKQMAARLHGYEAQLARLHEAYQALAYRCDPGEDCRCARSPTPPPPDLYP